MSENFDEENLKRIIADLPQEATQHEIFALFMTILDAYQVEPDDRVNLALNILGASGAQVVMRDEETPLH